MRREGAKSLELTPEQRSNLLDQHRGDLDILVVSYMKKHNLQGQYYDDLFHAAVKGFLEHLHSMPSLDHLWGFIARSKGEIIKCWRSDFPMRLPAKDYMKHRQKYEFLSYDMLEETLARTEEEIPACTEEETEMMVEDFGRGLQPEQIKALMLKAKYGCSNAELQEVLGTNSAGVTRFFQKLRRRAMAYFDRYPDADA